MSETGKHPLFQGCSIVACGTLHREIRGLADNGFLDADRILFTAPGLHERPDLLEEQLTRQLRKAREISEKVIVVYGEKCYLGPDTGDTDSLLRRLGPEFIRVRAKNCIDMLADSDEQNQIAKGAKVYWLTPGWLEHWEFIFKDWDVGKANETFPQHDKAIVLDAIGCFDRLMAKSPERILQISDWMKLPIEPFTVSLERMKHLLAARLAVSPE